LAQVYQAVTVQSILVVVVAVVHLVALAAAKVSKRVAVAKVAGPASVTTAAVM
jgi:hypothetical protein